jgi:hypothetical protein
MFTYPFNAAEEAVMARVCQTTGFTGERTLWPCATTTSIVLSCAEERFAVSTKLADVAYLLASDTDITDASRAPLTVARSEATAVVTFFGVLATPCAATRVCEVAKAVLATFTKRRTEVTGGFVPPEKNQTARKGKLAITRR